MNEEVTIETALFLCLSVHPISSFFLFSSSLSRSSSFHPFYPLTFSFPLYLLPILPHFLTSKISSAQLALFVFVTSHSLHLNQLQESIHSHEFEYSVNSLTHSDTHRLSHILALTHIYAPRSQYTHTHTHTLFPHMCCSDRHPSQNIGTPAHTYVPNIFNISAAPTFILGGGQGRFMTALMCISN